MPLSFSSAVFGVFKDMFSTPFKIVIFLCVLPLGGAFQHRIVLHSSRTGGTVLGVRRFSFSLSLCNRFTLAYHVLD